MKQYTIPEQTAKLIELGFEKPKSIVDHDGFWGYNYAYSIGELIEMLPNTIENSLLDCSLSIYTIFDVYQVEYSNILGETYFSSNVELINALYDMVVRLKEEGVL